MVRNICPSIHFLVLFGLVFKAGHSSFKKVAFICFDESPLKNIEKCYLFHVKNSFGSRDIYNFALTFWLCRKMT